MTLQQWIQSLILRREFTIDSSNTLVTRVNKVKKSKTFHGRRKKISPVTQFQTPSTHTVSVLELLLDLGKITTPRIPNLVDLASTWAIIRYIWAFDPDLNQPGLVLSNYARNLDFHQKAVLSDDFGVAFSSFIVRKFFGGRWAQPVSIAIRKQSPAGIKLKYNTSPDYIFKSSSNGYIIAECKGTITKKQTSINQLGRGREQIPSVTIASAQTLGLITGACMMDKNTTVYIVDPPEENQSGSEENTFFIPDSKQLDNEIETIFAANQLRFAGLDRLALRVISSLQEQRDEFIYDRKLEIIKKESIDEFDGIISPYFYLGDGLNLRMYKGISNYVVKGFNESIEFGMERMQNYKVHFSKLKMFIKNVSEGEWPVIFSTNNSVNIISEDGTLMSIEINETD